MEPHRIWIEQCEAARGIEDEFGTDKALDYLVGEKFLNFLEAAESNADFRAEIPAFVAEIKTIFEPWQLAQYLETARETEPFDPGLFESNRRASPPAGQGGAVSRTALAKLGQESISQVRQLVDHVLIEPRGFETVHNAVANRKCPLGYIKVAPRKHAQRVEFLHER